MTDIATLGLDVDTRRLRPAVREVNRFTDSMKTAGRQAETMGGSISRSMGQLAAIVGVGAAVSRALGAAEQYTNTTNRLKAMGASAEDAADQFERLTEVANATRAPISSVANLYTRLQLSAKNLGASQEQLLGFTNAVGLALGTSGSSAAEASGALTQLSQALAGGVVRAEEFNSIVEGAPGILIAAANGIAGVNGDLGVLRQMMLDGKLTADVFFNALLSQTGALETAFAQTVPTISQALSVLNNNFTALVGKFDSAAGVSTAFANVILALADNLDRIAVYGATAAAVFGGAYVGAAIASRVATLGFAGALGILRTALVRTGIGLAVVAAGELIFQFTNLVRTTGSVGAAISAVKNITLEALGRMGMAAQGYGLKVQAMSQNMAVSFLTAIQNMALAAYDFFADLSANLSKVAGMEAIASTVGELRDASSASYDAVADISIPLRESAAAARDAGEAMLESASKPLASLGALKTAVEGSTESAKGLAAGVAPANALAGALAGGGGGSGGGGGGGISEAAQKAQADLEALRAEADSWTDRTRTPVEKYNAEMAKLEGHASSGRIDLETYRRAVGQLNDELTQSTPIIGDVATAFGDWISGGLQDFKGFVGNIVGSFRKMLSDMISTAAANPIRIALGMTGGAGAAGAAGAGPMGAGGPLGGILGGVGTFAGSAASGFGSVVSGLMSGGLGGATSAIGTAIGGATTGIAGLGAAIGAVAAPIAAVAAIFMAFKTKTKLLDSGLRVTVDGLDAVIETFKKVEKSRLFGLSKSKSTSYDIADADVADPISSAIQSILSGIGEGAGALGLDRSKLSGLDYDFQLSTKDKSDSEIQAMIEGELAGLSDAAVRAVAGAAIDRFKAEGEGLGDTLNRLVGNLTSVNDVLDQLQAGALDASVSGAAAATAMANAAGGLDGLASAAATYISEFWTEGERMESATRRVAAAFGEIGAVLPQSRAEFRAMVEAIDTTTESGAELYGKMMDLAGSFAAVTPAVGLLTPAMDELRKSLITQVDGLIGQITDMQTQETKAARDWKAAAGRIKEFVQEMKETVGNGRTGTQARAALEANYQMLLARAVAGDRDAVNEVTGVAGRLVDLAGSQAKTQLEAQMVQGRVMSNLKGIGVLADVEAERHALMAGILGAQVDILTEVRDTLLRGDELTAGKVEELKGKVEGVGTTIATAEKASIDVLKSYGRVGLDGLAATKEIGNTGRYQLSSLDKLRELTSKIPGGISGALNDAFGDTTDQFAKGISATLSGPLGNITKGLDTLKTGLSKSADNIKKSIDRQTVQMNLNAAIGRRDAGIAAASGVVAKIRDLENSTGGVIQNKDNQATKFVVDEKGVRTPNGDMAWVSGTPEALASFKKDFWGAGGLQSQLWGASRSITNENDTIEKLRKQMAAFGGIPAYAAGGTHTGGVRLVGEQGPELEVTGPARYHSASKTKTLLKGGDDGQTVNEIRILRNEMRQLGMEQVRHAKTTAKTLQEWNRVGQPETRDLTVAKEETA